MNGGSPGPASSAPANLRDPPRWQSALVIVSLSLLSLLVLLPAGCTLLLGSAVVVLAVSAQQLEAVGALAPEAFAASVYLMVAMLGLASVVWARESLGRLTRGPAVPGLGMLPAARGAWGARHPWLSAGLACGIADLALIPTERLHLVDVPTGLVGALILTTAVLVEVGLAYALVRACYRLFRATWRLTRRSSFAAGAVTAGSLSAALAAYVFASALSLLGTALASEVPTQSRAPCTSPALTCARQALEAAARTPSAPALPPPETQDAFSACVEELYRDDPIRGNARNDALRDARFRVSNPEEAADVVEDTLIEVCLNAERFGDVRGYFIRSVRNNVVKAARRQRRFCALEPESPDWLPDGCVARTVEQEYVQAEMQAAVHDALCSLDRGDRTVIELRVWKRLSHREIATKLGMTEAAARQRYLRAKEALRSEFSLRCR